MSEMERFERELNELEPDTIKDEEFKKRLYFILMKKYGEKKFVPSSFLKVSLTIGLIFLLALPLYFIFYLRTNRNITKREEVTVMQEFSTPQWLITLTKNDELINVAKTGNEERLIYKSGLEIVKEGDEIVRISYGTEIPIMRDKEYGERISSSALNDVKEIVRKDARIGFLMKEGKIIEAGEIDKNLFYIILKTPQRKWKIITNIKEERVVSFFSPPY